MPQPNACGTLVRASPASWLLIACGAALVSGPGATAPAAFDDVHSAGLAEHQQVIVSGQSNYQPGDTVRPRESTIAMPNQGGDQ